MNYAQLRQWQPSNNDFTIETIDYHTGGEPLRIITSGFPNIPGRSILEKRRYCQAHLDYLRTFLMFEPRGHADMYGCVLTEPEREDSDIGVFFIHNEGYSSMCGHAIIAITTACIDSGLIEKQIPMTQIKIDTPAGQITSSATLNASGHVEKVTFENVPSFVVGKFFIDLEEYSNIPVTIAYGGAYYAYVETKKLPILIQSDNTSQIIALGTEIKKAVQNSVSFNHPFEEDLSFLYGTIFISEPHENKNHSRNVCVFADGEVDRSPTGTGVSGRAAIHFFEDELPLQTPIQIESIVNSTFTVSVKAETTFGPHRAIIPEVSGNAFITGKHSFYFNPNDPLNQGFLLR